MALKVNFKYVDRLTYFVKTDLIFINSRPICHLSGSICDECVRERALHFAVLQREYFRYFRPMGHSVARKFIDAALTEVH